MTLRFLIKLLSSFIRINRLFERVVGLEPTLFHIGSVVPYQLGDTRVLGGIRRVLSTETSSLTFVRADRDTFASSPGFEPGTYCLTDNRSKPTELRRHYVE